MKKTNWDIYYNNSSIFSFLTQRVSQAKINNLIKLKIQAAKGLGRICEFGGANSCFADSICSNFDVSEYMIIDNSKFGLKLSFSKFKNNKKINIACLDVLNDSFEPSYDFVFSAGLIEHFDKAGTFQVIRNHFQAVRPGGYVLITFPTPTFQYRLFRRLMERLGVWQFFDERPLKSSEVCQGIEHFGEVICVTVNRLIPLSQGIVLARKF